MLYPAQVTEGIVVYHLHATSLWRWHSIFVKQHEQLKHPKGHSTCVKIWSWEKQHCWHDSQSQISVWQSPNSNGFDLVWHLTYCKDYLILCSKWSLVKVKFVFTLLIAVQSHVAVNHCWKNSSELIHTTCLLRHTHPPLDLSSEFMNYNFLLK